MTDDGDDDFTASISGLLKHIPDKTEKESIHSMIKTKQFPTTSHMGLRRKIHRKLVSCLLYTSP